MQVFVNGTAHDCGPSCSLAGLLEQLGIDPKTCATAVNGAFIARAQRADRMLSANDQVMTFEPITGG